jgi:hypothetical protein
MRTLMITARIPMTLTHVHGQLSQAWLESVLDAMTAAFRPSLSSARAYGWRILKALHDSRRLQAAREIERHRHLLQIHRAP